MATTFEAWTDKKEIKMSGMETDEPDDLVDRIQTSFPDGREHIHELRYRPDQSTTPWRLKSKIGAMGWMENFASEAEARAAVLRWDTKFGQQSKSN